MMMEGHGVLNSSASSTPHTPDPQENPSKLLKQPSDNGFHKFLHSKRKLFKQPSNKRGRKLSFPIAPLPPTPARIYEVDSVNFREVVQMLTGAPKPPSPSPHQPQQLQVSPSPVTGADDAYFGKTIEELYLERYGDEVSSTGLSMPMPSQLPQQHSGDHSWLLSVPLFNSGPPHF